MCGVHLGVMECLRCNFQGRGGETSKWQWMTSYSRTPIKGRYSRPKVWNRVRPCPLLKRSFFLAKIIQSNPKWKNLEIPNNPFPRMEPASQFYLQVVHIWYLPDSPPTVPPASALPMTAFLYSCINGLWIGLTLTWAHGKSSPGFTTPSWIMGDLPSKGIVSIKRIEHQPTSGGFWWSLAEEEPYSIGALARYN